MRKSRGFTLVELLVVIGIIALLISILLPALNKARQQAGKVKCMSNMRSLMQAVQMYTSENKNLLPFANWDGGPNTSANYFYGWLYTNKPSLRVGYSGSVSNINGTWATPYPSNGVETGVLWPYLRQLAIYHCPMDTESGFWTGTEWLTSYIMNGSMYYFYDKKTPPTPPPVPKITQFHNTAECVLLWENMEQAYAGQTGVTSYSNWNDGSSAPNQGVLSDRHYKGANLAFLDGHVDWWDASTWNYYAQVPTTASPPAVAPGPNALWCCPTLARGGAPK